MHEIFEHLVLTPVKLFGTRGRRIGIFGDIMDPRSRSVSRIKDITIEDISEDAMFRNDEPPLSMTQENTQCLFQDLWDLGFRPKSEDGNVGAFAAQGAHLKDMQKIAFAGLSEMQKKLNASYLVIGESGNGQAEIEKS